MHLLRTSYVPTHCLMFGDGKRLLSGATFLASIYLINVLETSKKRASIKQ